MTSEQLLAAVAAILTAMGGVIAILFKIAMKKNGSQDRQLQMQERRIDACEHDRQRLTVDLLHQKDMLMGFWKNLYEAGFKREKPPGETTTT